MIFNQKNLYIYFKKLFVKLDLNPLIFLIYLTTKGKTDVKNLQHPLYMQTSNKLNNTVWK